MGREGPSEHKALVGIKQRKGMFEIVNCALSIMTILKGNDTLGSILVTHTSNR